MIDVKLNSKVDGYLGVLIGVFISVCIFLGFLIPMCEFFSNPISYSSWWKITLLSFGLLCATATEGWFVITALLSMIRKRYPIGIAIAVLQPKAPFILRPLISLWWLFHALMGIAMGTAIVVSNIHAPWYGHLIITIITGALAYMAYVFVMLSVTAFPKSPTILFKAWNLRIWWGAIACLFTLLIPIFSMH